MNAAPKACLAALALVAGVLEAAAAEPSAAPVVRGPQVAERISFEFAVYYPNRPAVEPMAALRQRAGAGVAMPRLVDRISDTEPAAQVSGIRVEKAGRDYAPPSADMIERFGHGFTPAQADALTHAGEALRIDFAHAGKDRIAALRSAQLLVEQVARDTHGVVWDDETREAFTPDAWHQSRVLGWDGDVPDVANHTVIHFYDTGRGYRCITLGMAKFGEPDVVIEDVVASDARDAGDVVNLLSQALVEGATADAQGQLTLRLQQSRHAAVNRRQGEGLKANAQRVARLLLVQAVRQQGDADNRLVRIAFDRYDGPDEHAREAALIAALYGGEDGVTRIHHDARLLAARDAARARLPQLRDLFNRGLAPGEYIDVKAPFDTDSGGREWMWVEVRAWKGDRIEGTLQNTPDDVKRLRLGQDVVVSQAELFDYLFHHADGRDEGNTTGAIIEEAERPAK